MSQMSKKYRFLWITAAVVMSSSLTSCGSDDSATRIDPVTPTVDALNWVGSKICVASSSSCAQSLCYTQSCTESDKQVGATGNVARIIDVDGNSRSVFTCETRTNTKYDAPFALDGVDKTDYLACSSMQKETCTSDSAPSVNETSCDVPTSTTSDAGLSSREQAMKSSFSNNACPAGYEFRALESSYAEGDRTISEAYECIRVVCGTGSTARQVSAMTDASNCGACGNVCDSGMACVDGRCSDQCPSGYQFCNSGCIPLSGSHVVSCNEGNLCEPFSCEDGYLNLDGNYVNGCESQASSLNIESVINYDNSGDGSCQIALKCSTGRYDANGLAIDGCEADFSAIHCTIDGNLKYDGVTGAVSSCTCEEGYFNANGSMTDGCEADFESLNCLADNLKHESGQLVSCECKAGFGNLDGDLRNGCESQLDGVHVESVTTDSSGNTVLKCVANWGDCDGLTANGCETDLTRDDNCGACGTVCDDSKGANVATAKCDKTLAQCVAETCTSSAFSPSATTNACVLSDTLSFTCCGPVSETDGSCLNCLVEKVGAANGTCNYTGTESVDDRCVIKECRDGFRYEDGQCVAKTCDADADCGGSTNKCDNGKCVCGETGNACGGELAACKKDTGTCHECSVGVNSDCAAYVANDENAESAVCTNDYKCEVTCKTGFGFNETSKKCEALSNAWCEVKDGTRVGCSDATILSNLNAATAVCDTTNAKCRATSCIADEKITDANNRILVLDETNGKCITHDEAKTNLGQSTAANVRAIKQKTDGWKVSGCRNGYLPNGERNRCNGWPQGDSWLKQRNSNYSFYSGGNMACQMFDYDQRDFVTTNGQTIKNIYFTATTEDDLKKLGSPYSNLCWKYTMGGYSAHSSNPNLNGRECFTDWLVHNKWFNPFMTSLPVYYGGGLSQNDKTYNELANGQARYACVCGRSSVVCSPGQFCLPYEKEEADKLTNQSIANSKITTLPYEEAKYRCVDVIPDDYKYPKDMQSYLSDDFKDHF